MTAARTFLHYGQQCIDADDIQAVIEVLQSPNLTQGPKIAEFESALSGAVGAGFSVAFNSGTSALHSACLAAGVGPGDEVITSPVTFVASANCIVYCGALPVFADILPDTYNISPGEIAKKITAHTKAIIPVDLAGQSCDMEEIRAVVRAAEKKYGHRIFIIEDASHALGSLYKAEKVGSCSYSDVTVMSFHPVKHITTGEGGVAFTNNQSMMKKMRLIRSHGITGDPEEFRNRDMAFYEEPHGQSSLMNPWYYEQISLGYNYRITDIQCALGLSQLKKLAMFRMRRREIVNAYNEAFRDMRRISSPFESPACDSNFHLYILLFDFEEIGMDRARFMCKLKAQGIQTQVHYIPVHLQTFYKMHLGTKRGDYPRAEYYYDHCLSIPLHPSLCESDVKRVITEIKGLVRDRAKT